MKKLATLAIGLLLVSGSPLRALAENRQVNADSLYVRMNPHGFFVGTLYRNAGFYRQQTSGDYAYGYAGGNFQGCGWVETAWTVPGGSTTPGCTGAGFNDTGVASRQYLLAHYASRVNDYIPGLSLPLANGGSAVRIKPGVVAGVYGNYRGGSHQNLYYNIDENTPLAWRWVSADGRSVAVNVNPGQANAFWGFVLREKLPDRLPYSDGVSR